MTVKSSGGRIWASPWASFAPPTPPAKATIFINLFVCSGRPHFDTASPVSAGLGGTFAHCASRTAYRAFIERLLYLEVIFFHVLPGSHTDTQQIAFLAAPNFPANSKSFEWSLAQRGASKPRHFPSPRRERRAVTASLPQQRIEPPSCIRLYCVSHRGKNPSRSCRDRAG